MPDIPEDMKLLYLPSERNLDVTDIELEEFKVLIKNCESNGFRLPLQIALFISPIFLLIPVKLRSASWDREEILRFAKALGNQKPELLQRIEKEIWFSILEIAIGTKQPYTAMKVVLENLPWSEIEEMDDFTLEYFKPDPLSHSQLPSLGEVNLEGKVSKYWPRASSLQPLLRPQPSLPEPTVIPDTTEPAQEPVAEPEQEAGTTPMDNEQATTNPIPTTQDTSAPEQGLRKSSCNTNKRQLETTSESQPAEKNKKKPKPKPLRKRQPKPKPKPKSAQFIVESEVNLFPLQEDQKTFVRPSDIKMTFPDDKLVTQERPKIESSFLAFYHIGIQRVN
ncbi:hypothetical protein GALMADRAFT_144965 [Galerina marginata CBS 339.88]|uniref:Uncharacterized protein n=1 Tax=Galerina marginata (strain CBS 339.88) TaxID=685588 RepID=A0A067SHC4_GALM3|nr:hypothetical protein GALMADRAFT_144965 [Galerina marginata CBS 339.88]